MVFLDSCCLRRATACDSVVSRSPETHRRADHRQPVGHHHEIVVVTMATRVRTPCGHPHHGHRRRSGRAHHNLQLPRLSTAQVCSRQGGFYGWRPQERAGLPASWWRAASSLLTSARPPRRSSLRSVSRKRISTMRAVGGRMPGVRRGTGRSGVSVACSRSHRALRATSPLEGGRSR